MPGRVKSTRRFPPVLLYNAGDDTMETIEALEIIGAKNMADTVRRAAAVVPGGMPPKDRFARQHFLLEKYPQAEASEALNDEFFGYPDNVARLLAKFKATASNGWSGLSMRVRSIQFRCISPMEQP